MSDPQCSPPISASRRSCLRNSLTGMFSSHMSLKFMLRYLQFTPERYWALRGALEMQQETLAVMQATARSLTTQSSPFRFIDYELFVPRRHVNNTLFVHARAALFNREQALPCFEPGQGPVTSPNRTHCLPSNRMSCNCLIGS